MSDDPELRFTEEEAIAFLGKLMPEGFAGADVLSELAPEGWEECGLVRAYHPTREQWHAERVAMHENVKWLQERANAARRKRGEDVSEKGEEPPTFEESVQQFKETPIQAEDECREIVGAVLWEIFSDNHSVIADDGREVDLGSFRGASATLDTFDVSMRRKSEPHAGDASGERNWAMTWDRADCMRFYMGLAFISRRTDFRPVYELIFRRLKTLGANWIYRFPRIGVVRFDRPEDSSGDPADYSPSEAFAREQKKREDDEAFARMEAELEEAYRASAEAAAKAEPPSIVQAYRNVYGRFPDGWPPA